MSEHQMSNFSKRIDSLSPEQRALFDQWLKKKGLANINAALEKAAPFSSAVRAEEVANDQRVPSTKDIEFSLFFFSGDGATSDNDKYRLILECAKFAEQHDFSAVWVPERHFKPFGGLYPNPSVLAAALAMITKRVQIRAGSVVLPLQNPIRVAEEWSVVDNLSNGRVGVAFASGWLSDDFVLAPEMYSIRRESMYREIETVRKLWKGDTHKLLNGSGEEIHIRIFPNPLQKELPIWLTAASEETFIKAGKIGAGVLTGLMEQGIDQCAERISLYRKSLEENGHDPRKGHVTVMLHTFVGENTAAVKAKVREPLYSYLRTFLQMSERRLSEKELGVNLGAEDEAVLLSHAFERYFNTSGLLGTLSECRTMIDRLRRIDVDEVACLLDFGLDFDSILEGLYHLNLLREDCARQRVVSV